ncbi:hypothetical protein [Pelagibius marinus]|uniref:hypothetical protein n=1 Tax=Pelagibius marinus TaxID=2762760 RepID=UPI001872A633|nr:hypothetical protein [Pelagibius marinus]
MAIIGVIAVSGAIRQWTGDAGADVDAARSRMCAAPSTNTIEGDLSPGSFRYQSTMKKESDDKERYATFLKHALPRLQVRDVEAEPDFYVTFSVYFDYGPGRAKQLAAAGICKEKFGTADNACRNRTYLFYSDNEPEVLAELIVDDILKSEPIRKCRNA